MLDWIALFCLLLAVSLLVALSIIDFKTRLLPNKLVAGFATLGILFHLTSTEQYLTFNQILLGGAFGFGSLYLLRACANYIYKDDALGLGDVKLMGAGGLWLGMDLLMIALIVGALASMIHGLIYGIYIAKRAKEPLKLATLGVPAGPGFAIGLVFSGSILLNGFFGTLI
jgi:leader peptidase (prepilin peptidase)/N-methyltransferase